MRERLQQYYHEMQEELAVILAYWKTHTPDKELGGFAGKINHANEIIPGAPKGVVLNARILWTFAAAHSFTNDKNDAAVAQRAYDYLNQYFFDTTYGGVYWSVAANGSPLDRKKQVYGISFVIYGLAEYYKLHPQEELLQKAQELYRLLIKHAYDAEQGGFIEALAEDWSKMQDYRLSDKDSNTPKSMNTMLHVMEAFTNLYRIWPDKELEQQLASLIEIFCTKIIHPVTGHLQLFFSENWTAQGHEVSFGHDIEAAWLLQEAAEVLGNEELLSLAKQKAIHLSTAAAKGIDDDGALWNESDDTYTHWSCEKHWWPQAEAMVGFFNAWQLTGEDVWLQRSLNAWEFVKSKLKDPAGEWYWGIEAANKTVKEDKAGFWKCPYHNSRACMEIITRIRSVLAADVIKQLKHETSL
jgi:mannobiose 2-epimerase